MSTAAKTKRPKVNVSDYLGLWSILESPYSMPVTNIVEQGLARLSAVISARADYGDDDDDDEENDEVRPHYQIASGVAVLDLIGPLMKWNGIYFGGTSTTYTRRCVASCETDSRVQSVLVRISSPGGTVAGTQELGADIARLALQKPCYGLIEDVGASAAFWAGSQCTKLFAANETTLVGSIGTYMAVDDYSKMFEINGVKRFLVKEGEFKGAGTPGTEITQEQLDQWQSLIKGINDQFVRAAAQGRKMALRTMRGMADGRAHLAADAAKMGLIDGIQGMDETLAMLTKARAPRSRATEANGLFTVEMRGEGSAWNIVARDVAPETLSARLAEFETQALSNSGAAGPAGPDAIGTDSLTPGAKEEISTMADTTTATKIATPAGAVALEPGSLLRATLGSTAATLGELEAACSGADEKFLLAQLRGGVTVDAARANWTAELKNRLDAKQTELTAATAAAAKKPGVDPLLDTTTGADAELHGDPIGAWEKLQAGAFAKRPDNKALALRELVAEHGDAHDAYVTAYNAANPFKRRR